MSLPTLESSHTRQGFASELCITVSAATIGDEEAQGIPAQLLKHRNHFLKCRMLYWEPDWLVSGCSVSNLLNLDANDSLLDITLAYFRFTSDNLGIEGANSWIQFQGRLFPYSVDLSAGPSDSDDEHNAIGLDQDYSATPLVFVQREMIFPIACPYDSSEVFPNLVSFLGEVDNKTYSLTANAFSDLTNSDAQLKACSFFRLQAYISVNSDSVGSKYYGFHILVVFPLDAQPYKSQLGYLISKPSSNGPFHGKQMMFIYGSIVGVLHHKYINESSKVRSNQNILVIVPHSHQGIVSSVTWLKESSQPSTPSKYLASDKKGNRRQQMFSQDNKAVTVSGPVDDKAAIVQEQDVTTPSSQLITLNPPANNSEPEFTMIDSDSSEGNTIEESPSKNKRKLGKEPVTRSSGRKRKAAKSWLERE